MVDELFKKTDLSDFKPLKCIFHTPTQILRAENFCEYFTNEKKLFEPFDLKKTRHTVRVLVIDYNL